MKKVLLTISSILLIILLIIIIKALIYQSKQLKVAAIKKLEINNSSLERLSQAVKFPTISYDDTSKIDTTAFKNLHHFLFEQYPLCHSKLKKNVISNYSLIYKWEGKNKNLKPILLLAHMDVVPANGQWQEEAFSGTIKNNFIWGRGTLDDKVSVLGILEAAEMLLKENFKPERTIYFAFGHDEETMGNNGAHNVAGWMKKNNINAEFILDEGMIITEGIVPGLEQPAALIGIAEKGYLTLKVTVETEGGHSSMPQKETAIGILANGIQKMQNEPFNATLTEPSKNFLDYIGPEMPFAKRLIFANTWLFKKLIIGEYEKTSSGNAIIRTTIAPVVFNSGIKENIIPAKAEAILNIRSLPDHSNFEIIETIKEKLNDHRIKIEPLNSINPSKVSSTASPSFKLLNTTIRQVFPDVIVAPSLMIAGTDSKHYNGITEDTYRFLPIRYKKEDLARLHGANERIATEGYKDVIRFYYQLMKNINIID